MPGAYQDSQPPYPAASAAAGYAGTAYSAAAYPGAQYGAYPQQQYQQPYAAATNGATASQGKRQI